MPWRAWHTRRHGAAGAATRKVVLGASAVPLVCAGAAAAPDLDLLLGTHSTYTHSVGAVALVFVIVLAATSFRGARLATAIALAWASHLLLDWLGSDTRDPIGIMALWPFTAAHYQSSLHLFSAISRRYWMPEQFIVGNLKAAVREVAVLAPIAFVAWRVARRRPTHKTPGRARPSGRAHDL